MEYDGQQSGQARAYHPTERSRTSRAYTTPIGTKEDAAIRQFRTADVTTATVGYAAKATAVWYATAATTVWYTTTAGAAAATIQCCRAASTDDGTSVPAAHAE